ncbi:MAG: hypothetical protein U0K79_08860 [Phascolarctobacterium sp.]|nr:hypothetical protein [Phascolarctobacterium sp.]
MGAVKKVFKSVGGLLGFGSDTGSIQQIKMDPAVTNVSNQDVSGDTGSDSRKKKRRGFASTSTSLIGDANSTNKDTLG